MPQITRRSSTLRVFGKCGSIAVHASSDNQNNERDIPIASCLSEEPLNQWAQRFSIG
jgi:hypothetical protein